MSTAHSYLHKPQQNLQELAEFVSFVRSTGARSYLEIGSKFGGALWAVSAVMPKGSRLVAVDLPNGQWGRSDSELSLRTCIEALRIKGFNAHLFLEDSTAGHVVAQVRALGPYDCIFIDANHTEPYVRKDFENYGRLGKHCCFHDISWRNPTPPKRLPIEVPKVWRELQETFRDAAAFREIALEERHNGIGIMSWKEE